VIRLPWRRACGAHRTALIEFAARRADGPHVRAALDHVDRCRSCEDDLAATTLVVHALRRLHEEISRVQPAPDGWARLRARLAVTRREPSIWMTSLPGAVLALGLVAMMGDPTLMHEAQPLLDDGPATVAGRVSADVASRFEPVDPVKPVRLIVPPAWRVQDLPRPSRSPGPPRAADVASLNGVDPPAADPTWTPDEPAPPGAQVAWR